MKISIIFYSILLSIGMFSNVKAQKKIKKNQVYSVNTQHIFDNYNKKKSDRFPS